MHNKKLLGCIADDFTGASDAASFLAAGGSNVILINGIPPADFSVPAGVSAVVVALKTRTQETGSAVKESLRAVRRLQALGAQQIYVKYCSTFDSTPRGNIGPICDAVMNLLKARYTLLCPSLPVNRRTVENGRLYVDGVPLEQTHMAQHPLTPMWDSFIPTLMKEQSRYPCHVLRRGIMEKGGEAVGRFIEKETLEEGHFYLVPDFSDEKDAKEIVSLFGELPLLTGGSGLLRELGKRYASGAEQPARAEANAGKAIILVGSCSVATQAQVRYYQKKVNAGVVLKAEELLAGRQTAENVWEALRQNGQEVSMVYSSGSAGQKSGKDKGEAAAKILEDTLAALARKAAQSGYTRFVAAGGETSGAVTKALGFSQYQIRQSIAPGVPVLVPLGAPGLRLVLKSGNFGQEDFFVRALAVLGGYDE